MSTDSKSFEDIAVPHLDAVYRAAVAICGHQRGAEDLVQETFLKAFERFELFEKGTNCKAWLLQILRNSWIDRLRHRKVMGHAVSFDEEIIVETENDDSETIWSNADDLLENFSDEQVIKALNELGPEQRMTLFLIDVEQMSQKEVAEITGVAVGTVKSRASRGRVELKRKLNAYAKEMGFIRGEK